MSVNLNPQNILATAQRLAPGGLGKLDQAALPQVVDQVAKELKANAAERVTVRSVLVEAWAAANDNAGLKARGSKLVAQGDPSASLGQLRASAGALGTRFSSPLAPAQVKTVDDIKAFAHSYGKTVESYAKSTTQQMIDGFQGAGLPAEVRQAASKLMKGVVADTAALFGPGGYAPPADRGAALAAANQHAGYVAGEIGRKLAPVSQQTILEHFAAIVDGKNPSVAALADKLAAAARPDDRSDIKAFVNNPDNGWMFGAYGFGKSDVALNLPGVLAGQATFDFATVLTGDADKARSLVAGTLALPSEVIAVALRGPAGVKQAIDTATRGLAEAQARGDATLEKTAADALAVAERAGKLSTEQLATLQFSARAAQAGWLTSKLGQGIVEAHHSDPVKAEKGLSRFAPKNDLITDFDSLAAKKGWAEVAKDIDQIKNATTRLHREELHLVEMASASDIRAIADQVFAGRDVRIATAGYSAAPSGYEAPTRELLEKLTEKLGSRVGLVSSPTADAGSIDAITTSVGQKHKAPVLNVTAESYVAYIKPESFPADIDRAAFAAAPKHVFADAAEYSKATAEASNVFLATGGRDATIGDFVNALKKGNKVVLLDNPALPGAQVFDKRGRPENAVALLAKVLKDGKLPADLTEDQERVLLNKGLTNGFLERNAAALKSLVTVVSLGEGVDAAVAAAAAAITR